jgi:hypothetical protein
MTGKAWYATFPTTHNIGYLQQPLNCIQEVQMMNQLLQSMQSYDTRTENNAITHSSSGNAATDFFFQVGALRGQPENKIITSFQRAFGESPLDTLRILFYARDIRLGQGERRTFRTILSNLARNVQTESIVERNLACIPYFGRWDDLFVLFGTRLEKPALDLIQRALRSEDRLCAKWMPREKSSQKAFATKIQTHMDLTPRTYRKLLSSLTQVVESQMCADDWERVRYSAVPSVAMKNYRKAFEKHSPERWKEFLENVKSGVEKVNAGALYPHDLIRPMLSDPYACTSVLSADEKDLLDSQWKALPNYLKDNSERIMPVVDTSGSMYSQFSSDSKLMPIMVSVSLGLYIAERNEGPFQDHFVTFSQTPSLQKVVGKDLASRVECMRNADWGYNTDLQKVFSLILKSAVRDNISENDMPSMILIISDMEFDNAVTGAVESTNMDAIRHKYSQAGYQLPKVVFWNVNAKSDNNPVKFDESGTALVSGFSPSIMTQILEGSEITPISMMRRVIDQERYSCVVL